MDDFLARTSETDMTWLYTMFLQYVAPSGKIMDLGCGASSATLFFAQHGFTALPVGRCKALCDIMTKRTGCQAHNLLFQELDYTGAFDGIWAYASYQYGETERRRYGRLFSDYTEDSLKSLLADAGGFDGIDLWISGDAHPDRRRSVGSICFAEKRLPNGAYQHCNRRFTASSWV